MEMVCALGLRRKTTMTSRKRRPQPMREVITMSTNSKILIASTGMRKRVKTSVYIASVDWSQLNLLSVSADDLDEVVEVEVPTVENTRVWVGAIVSDVKSS